MGLYPSFEVLMPVECCGHCLRWQEGRNTRLKGEDRNFIAVVVCDVQSYYRDQLRNDGIDRAPGYQEDSFPARMTVDSSPKEYWSILPSFTTAWCRLWEQLCRGDAVTQQKLWRRNLLTQPLTTTNSNGKGNS